MSANATDHVTSAETDAGTFVAHDVGAQISKWDSATFGPILFEPSNPKYGLGKSPHAGIPLCFPWFGMPTHADDRGDGKAIFLGQENADYVHGFARSLPWTLVQTSSLSTGEWTVAYRLTDGDVPEEIADVLQPFTAELTATLGDTAGSVTLTVTNPGEMPFYFEEALHAYFRVGDLREVEVDGFDGLVYLDKTSGGALELQRGPITFGEEVDRVFPTDSRSPVILDRSLGRQITIENQNSGTSIVWNPGPVLSEQIFDLAPGEWNQFVCVETGNAHDAIVYLAPGETSSMTATYTVTKLED